MGGEEGEDLVFRAGDMIEGGCREERDFGFPPLFLPLKPLTHQRCHVELLRGLVVDMIILGY